MTDAEWKWDETLFGGSARYYREGRFPYPAELATAVQEELGLDGIVTNTLTNVFFCSEPAWWATGDCGA